MIVFCDWKARWWNDQQTDGQDMEGLSDELAEGLLAYAGRQAAVEVSLADRFTQKWAAVCKRAQPLIARFWGTDSVKTRYTLRIFLLHQVRSGVWSSGVGVGSEFGLGITRGRKDDAASAYVLRPL